MFGEDCRALETMTPGDFEGAVQRILAPSSMIDYETSGLASFSQWLCDYSSAGLDETEMIEIPGRRLTSSSSSTVSTTTRVVIARISTKVKVGTKFLKICVSVCCKNIRNRNVDNSRNGL